MMPLQHKECVLHTQFNQDGSCLAISTNLGVKVYNISQPTRIQILFEKRDIGIVSLVEMQVRTNILAFVTRSTINPSQQKLSEYDQSGFGNKLIQEQAHSQKHSFQYEKYLPSDSNFEESKDGIFSPEFDDTIERSRMNSMNISKEK